MKAAPAGLPDRLLLPGASHPYFSIATQRCEMTLLAGETGQFSRSAVSSLEQSALLSRETGQPSKVPTQAKEPASAGVKVAPPFQCC